MLVYFLQKLHNVSYENFGWEIAIDFHKIKLQRPSLYFLLHRFVKHQLFNRENILSSLRQIQTNNDLNGIYIFFNYPLTETYHCSALIADRFEETVSHDITVHSKLFELCTSPVRNDGNLDKHVFGDWSGWNNFVPNPINGASFVSYLMKELDFCVAIHAFNIQITSWFSV